MLISRRSRSRFCEGFFRTPLSAAATGIRLGMKHSNTKYKKYIGAILENINWLVVYIAGAIQCGAEMLLLAAPPAISAVLAAL